MNRLKPKTPLQVAILVTITVLIVAGAWLMYSKTEKNHAGSDATEQFLARHWAYPLAPQGEPPSGFTAVESSLAPEACGTCHVAQYADWRTSLHSRSVGPGLLWQFRVLSQEESNSCLRCHAPLAEQKALAALQHGWSNAPKSPVPEYVSPDLHQRGLVCAACHVRRHQRYGPPVVTGASAPAATSAARQPHDGFVVEPAFQDSRFCATCHQFRPEGRRLAGKLVENTYEEWLASPAAAQGQTCQSCHMPGRRHLWRGVHDREMVDKGLRRELLVKRISASTLSVQTIISAPGVGHYFPTYVVPKVTVDLRLQAPSVDRVIVQHVIGRTVGVDMDREFSDTRIPPGGRLVLSEEVRVPSGATRVVLRMEVAPAEQYVRMFMSMLDRNPDMNADTRAMLQTALKAARATTYKLNDLSVAVPAEVGKTLQAVAN